MKQAVRAKQRYLTFHLVAKFHEMNAGSIKIAAQLTIIKVSTGQEQNHVSYIL